MKPKDIKVGMYLLYSFNDGTFITEKVNRITKKKLYTTVVDNKKVYAFGIGEKCKCSLSDKDIICNYSIDQDYTVKSDISEWMENMDYLD